ncbi:MAG: patatin-like phospholipase family protein [Rubellimicrobium sp.]|nr:patatin-like phospholipase family protein [Rubellimicrobium sp.]
MPMIPPMLMTRSLARIALVFLLAFGGTARAAPPADGEVWVGIALSGGGVRATAFSWGVLQAIAAETLADATPVSDHIRFVAGVSGGSIMATAFTLRGMSGLRHFRNDWLLADVESAMTATLDAQTVLRGVDGRATLGRLLDDRLFHGATFADIARRPAMLRVVASDTAAAAPFVFDAITFGALCTDLSRIRLSDAVTASAAVPVVFAAVPVARYSGCTWHEPPAYAAARADEAAHPAVRLLARTVASYTDPAQVRSVQLLDGSMAETYGTSGFIAARAEGGLSPMTDAEALRVRRMLFLAVNSSHENWWITDQLIPAGRVLALSAYGLAQRLRNGGDLDARLSEEGITATMRDSFATLQGALGEWRRQIVEWRCGLDQAALDAMWPGRPADWACDELVVVVGTVGFDLLPDALRDTMNGIPTRLTLPEDSIDIAIGAGTTALRAAPAWNEFRRLLRE